MSIEQDRFRDYTTSGAFSMSLTRSQVAALSLVACTGEACSHAGTFHSLHTKGLVTTIRADDGGLETRLTEAGVYALKLVTMAELVQGPQDPVAEEIAALRSQLDKARRHAQQLASDLWDMDARVRKADLAIAEAKAWVSGSPLPPKPIVRMKNRHPERTQAQMMGHLRAAEKFLQAEEGCA